MDFYVPVWRFTRTDRGRAVWEWLADRGVQAARMREYVAETVDAPKRKPPEGVTVRVETPGAVGGGFRDRETLDSSDRAVVARRGGDVVGYCYLSHGREVYVDAINESVSFDGAYLRRLFVSPEHREQGVASAVVAAALAASRAEWGVDSVTALVASDNRPSQWVFEAAGFAVAGSVTFLRVGGWRWRRWTGRDS